VYRFRTLELAHPLFRGRGDSLMRWLGIPPRRGAYVQWMGRIFPEIAGTLLLGDGGAAAGSEDALDHGEGPIPYEDAQIDLDRARDLLGAPILPAPSLDPFEVVAQRQEAGIVRWAISRIKDPRRRRIVCQRFGLAGQLARSVRGIGETEGISGGRASMLEAESIRRLRQPGLLRPVVPWHERQRAIEHGLPDPGALEPTVEPPARSEHHFLAQPVPALFPRRGSSPGSRALPARVPVALLEPFLACLLRELGAPAFDLALAPSHADRREAGTFREAYVRWCSAEGLCEIPAAEGVEIWLHSEQRTSHFRVECAVRSGENLVLDGDARGLLAYRSGPEGEERCRRAVDRACALASVFAARASDRTRG